MSENDYATIKATEEYQRVVMAFDLSLTRWNDKQPNAINIPDHLAYLWDDLERVTAREGSIHPLFPMRIESLLLVLLADKIKKESLDPRGLLPHWSFRKRILTLEMEDNGIPAPENILDYVLWYGHCWELETNMIVMKSEIPVPQSWTLLQNMSRIHHARKLAKRNAVIYGIMTDGSKWVFIHLSNKSRHAIKVFSWDNEKHRIIGQVQNIIPQAATLHSNILSRSSLPTPTVHQISHCQIRELPAPYCGSDDENEEREENAFTMEEKEYTDIGPFSW